MSLVTAHVDDGVALVTLDDPDHRNALSTTLVGDIVSTFDWLEHNEGVRAVVLTGAPPAFCAGADLSLLAAGGQANLRSIYEGFLRIARSPLATVAAVNGAAVGAGVNMALVCDVILAGESARFDTRFLQLGLHPGGGFTWMLRNQLGGQGAAALALFGDRLDGREAERVGLAWRCHPDAELIDAARRLAAGAAAAPRQLTARVKETISDMHTIPDHEQAVDHELLAQVWSMEQPWFEERLSAAMQRNRPAPSR